MDSELLRAAEKGDVRFLENAVKKSKEISDDNFDYFLRRTALYGQKNILYLALSEKNDEWVEAAVKLLPTHVIQKLLCMGDIDGDTPLHYLARWRNIEIVKLLDVYDYQNNNTETMWSTQNQRGETPLHVTVYDDNTEVTKYLVEKHPRLASILDSFGRTFLHIAAERGYLRTMKAVDEIGDDEDHKMKLWRMKNAEGNTPLHIAATKDETAVAKFLLEKDPQLASVTNNSGDTPLHLASFHGSLYSVRLLLKYQQSQVARLVNQKQETPLHLAVIQGDSYVTEELINCDIELIRAANNSGDTPLHIAAIHGRDKVVENLINCDPVLVHAANHSGDTPLHLAAMHGHLKVAKHIINCDSKLVHVANHSGDTSLHLAAIHGHVEVAKDLINCDGELVGIANNSGDTPLHLTTIHGHVEVAKILINYDRKLACCVNKLRETPLHLAIKYDADAIISIEAEGIPKMIRMLVEETESSIACWADAEGWTPLHRAARLCASYNLRVVKLMIEKCPESAQMSDGKGNTILHMLINRITSYEQGKDLLQLPQIDALRNTKNKQGESPLDVAWKMNIRMVQALFHSSSAQQGAHNAEGFSTLSSIQQQYQIEMMEKRKRKMEEYGGVTYEVSVLRDRIHKFGMNLILSQDSKGRNVLHKVFDMSRIFSISTDAYVDLIHDILIRCPLLLSQTDVNGDTPLHILVRNPPTIQFCVSNNDSYQLSSFSTSHVLSKILELCGDYHYKAKSSDEGSCYGPPWLLQNMLGNTPLHEALLAKCDWKLVRLLCDLDIKVVAGLINTHKETPLHLLAGSSLLMKDKILSGDIITPGRIAILLMKANEKAVRLKDENDLYPLQRAIRGGLFETIDPLIREYPEAAEICDVNGQTFMQVLISQPFDFAYEAFCRLEPIWRRLLSERDKNGKTPLHLAIECQCMSHAFVFLRNSTNDELKLQDNEGNTPLHLIVHYCRDINFVDYFDKRSILNNNQIQTLKLLSIRNNKGKTPLHVAIERQWLMAVKNIIEFSTCKELGIQDNEGNTPLHYMVVHGGDFDSFAIHINADDPDARKLLSIRNTKGKTPLHLAIERQFLEAAEFIVRVSTWHELEVQDNEENTPLHHLVVHGGDSKFLADFPMKAIFKDVPNAKKLLLIKDSKGKAPLHLAIQRPCLQAAKLILSFCSCQELEVHDDEGNTPLHLAIQYKHFDFVLDLLTFAEESNKVDHLLEMKNKAGITPITLIGDTNIPFQLESYFMKKPNLKGIWSVYGIPNNKMQDYVNTLGVIAALLNTITFTAAFTVPGGLNQDHGTPLLMRKATFQAFMFFDVLTMCLSTIILFCLLAIMDIRNRRKSVLYLDFSISLLQISFYTTLLTFMTGVYAAFSPTKPWISIYTLVLCSAVLFIMFSSDISVLGFLIPFQGKFNSIVDKGKMFVVPSLKKMHQAIVRFGKEVLWRQHQEPPPVQQV